MNRHGPLPAEDDCIVDQINAKALCDRLREGIAAAGIPRRLLDALRAGAQEPGDTQELDGAK